MDLNGIRTLVIGGGIGGLTAALCLRARGAEVSVLEQAGAISEVGAGLQISPNGAAVLRALGLEEALAEEAPRARAVVLRDVAGRQVVRLDLDRLAPGRSYYLAHRADLIDLLAGAARAAGVRLRLLQRVERVELGPPARIFTSTGAEMAADLVVGADGLHSRARAALNGEARPVFTGQAAWRAVIDNDLGLRAEAQVFMGPGRHLVAYPLRGGRQVNLVAVTERARWTAEDWYYADSAENLRRAFAPLGGVVPDLLARVEAPGHWGLFRHPVAPVWQRGHLAILGDAAHPTLPFLAQGANLALEDAFALARCLAGAPTLRDGLVRFEAQRAPRARKVIAAANGNARKYHLRAPLAAPAHAALRLAGALAPGRMLRSFDWLYGHDVTA